MLNQTLSILEKNNSHTIDKFFTFKINLVACYWDIFFW